MLTRLRPIHGLLRLDSAPNQTTVSPLSLCVQSLSSSPESDLRLTRNQLVSLLTKQPLNRRLTQQIHAHIVTSGLIILHHASILFNPLLRRYSNGDFPHEALSLYKSFCRSPLASPRAFDSFTYLFLLQACSNSGSAMAAFQVHALIFKVGFHCNVFVQTGLVTALVSSGLLSEACQVFDEMPDRNSVSWNVIVSGLAKWGELESASALFLQMPNRTVESWTAIIDAHTRKDQFKKAIALFRWMVSEDYIQPTEVTLLAIIPAITNLGDLKTCQSVHAYGEKRGFNAIEIRLANSLIDSYSKCGCIRSASRFFEEISLERRNLISWSSIISAFAMHGMGEQVIEKFKAMEEDGFKPNRVTFISILNGCSHGGLVDQGLNFFNMMTSEYEITPDIKHYGCLVDLLGRAGRLEEAESVALQIPSEIMNVVVWRTLLGACQSHNNVEMGQRATLKILEMEKQYGGDYVAMSNIFSSVGRYDDSEKFRKLLDESNAQKVPGHSMV